MILFLELLLINLLIPLKKYYLDKVEEMLLFIFLIQKLKINNKKN